MTNWELSQSGLMVVSVEPPITQSVVKATLLEAGYQAARIRMFRGPGHMLDERNGVAPTIDQAMDVDVISRVLSVVGGPFPNIAPGLICDELDRIMRLRGLDHMMIANQNVYDKRLDELRVVNALGNIQALYDFLLKAKNLKEWGY